MAKVVSMTRIRKGLSFDFMMMILSFEAKLVVGVRQKVTGWEMESEK
jgi:hypothetical protein